MNLYLTPALQKFIPKTVDHQVQYTGMKLHNHVLCCAGTNGGKTNTLGNYIVEASKPRGGTFVAVYIVRKTQETIYNWMQEELKHQVHFFDSVESFPSVDEFPDAVDPANEGEILIVFDDCVTDRQKSVVDKIDKYFCYGRKKNLTIWYLSQSFYHTPTFIRKQICYLILLTAKGKRELQSILSDYGSLDCDTNTLYQIFKHATAPETGKIPFLKLDVTKCPLNKKFSRMWLDYIPLEDDEE